MYLPNKYTTWYYDIINSAQSRLITLDEYTEVHHIIPRSLGGTNDKSNLVRLTSREHFICHLLLTKMVTGSAKRSMSYALWGMCNQKNEHQQRHSVSSRTYQYAKDSANRSLSEERKGKTLEELHGVEKAAQIRETYKHRKPRSACSITERSNIGKAVSESWKRQVNPRGFQIKQPLKLTCPKCNKTMDKGNYTKYGHGLTCSYAIDAKR